MRSLMIIIYTAILCLPTATYSQVNFSEDIAPIIYENCTGCHRNGEVGPLALTNYQEVKSWASMIKLVTETRYMPPWSPDPNYRHLLNERVLTQEQIDLIGEWVDGGMEQGDPALEPELPDFPAGSQIGSPDVVLEMAETHTIEGNNTDDYHVFVIPTNFTEDKEIGCIEFRPGNNRAVHHVLVGYDTSGKAQAKDDATPGYGYFSFGDFGVNEAEYLSWGYVPGNIPLVYPEGIGEIIPAGADLLIQVHYAPLATEEQDKSSINIFFKNEDDPIEREVKTGWVLPTSLPGGWGSFFIPANTKKTFIAQNFYEDQGWIEGANFDVSLIGVQPHSHLLGTSYEIYAETPNADVINIINIPEYDFNWQGAYSMQKMLKIPANSTWYTKATYDNTIDNPANPSNPPKNVTWGEGTEDEMLVNLFYYVEYKEGDELIDLGQNTINATFAVNAKTKSVLYVPTPNPASSFVSVPFYLDKAETLIFELYDLEGQKIKSLSQSKKWASGFNRLDIQNLDLSGIHIVKMIGETYQLTQKIVFLK